MQDFRPGLLVLKMFLVGLTGGISTGKSTVSSMLSKEGCVVIDADLIARQVVSINSEGWRMVRQQFGNDICDSEGNIDRARLGEIIFSDESQRKKLNAITHPLILKRMLWLVFCNFIKGERYVILDIPLLSKQSPMFRFLSEVVTVHCDEGVQLERLMKRNSLTETEAKQRISSQMPLKEKMGMTTNTLCLIDNNGDIDSCHTQVLKLKTYLDSSWRPTIFRLSLVLFASGLIYLTMALV